MKDKKLTDAQISEFTRVAHYYYKEGCTQEQIAQRMNMSRQRVNRILADCLESGIVHITINPNPSTTLLELETRLKEKFGLLDIRVVDIASEQDAFRDLGAAAAQYLSTILRDNDVIGLTRGNTLAAMAEQMPSLHKKNVTVVQMLGSRNSEPQNTAANEIVHNISNRLGAKPFMLFAPIIVSSAEMKKSLQQEPSFIDTYHVIQSCNIAVVGIGAYESVDLRYSFVGVDIHDIAVLEEGQQLTGEVGSHLFDQDGKRVVNRYRDRIIAVELPDYLHIPVRIGVAGLPDKAKAIYAAIKGKYINVLIVDTHTAAMLCEM
ncbi:sugar-binding transcriptional regulator [Agathobaculum sp. LCP25S3_E8]|uniref:sugar-binding transcriptional regulator n=1 Tax=Agathobaculum sp. LCP25S3_E8 TaxID=3438735 RepID=UPI003F930C30